MSSRLVCVVSLLALAAVGQVPTASYVSFGAGCAEAPELPGLPGQVPVLFNMIGEAPAIGTWSVLRLGNLARLPAPHAIAWFVIGFSKSVNNGPLGAYPLPMDLAPVGAPGCTQLVAADFLRIVDLVALDPWIDLWLAVPAQPALVGTSFFVQAFVPDVFANPLGCVVSNGIIGNIGY